MSKTLIQQTAIEKLKRKERERERYFGFRNSEGFVAQAVLDRVELKLHPLQCCVHRWQIRYACRRVHCNLQTTTSTSMDEDVDEKEKRERERERLLRAMTRSWSSAMRVLNEDINDSRDVPAAAFFASISLSLSQIELNWIIVFDFSDSDICYAIVTFYYFEILGNDSGGNIGYVSPNLFFKRRRLKCAHWPPTTAWITNLYFFSFFLRNYKFCTLKKKIEEKHYFGS